MSKKTTKTDYSILAPKTERKLNKKQKNLLGYLEYRYMGYSQQRMENDDWFFISDREFMEETGIGSFSTLHVFLSSFILDGIIEKRTGDRHHSNQYRFTEAYRNSSFDYVPVMEKCSTKVIENVIIEEKSVAPTNGTVAPTIFPTQNVAQKCSTKHVDFERENEKSVAPHGKQKCSTDKDKDKDKELFKVTYYTSDCHQSDPDPVNNITSDLELYVEDNTPDVPEWMNELPVTEPFVQYTDDIQGEAMEKTNNTFQDDVRENDPDPVTDKINITSSDGIDGENALNGLKVALGVSPNELFQDEETDELFQDLYTDPDEPQETETSNLAVLSDERNSSGTTTHRQGESLSNGEKITSTSAIDPVTDNVNNNFNKNIQNMNVQERKEKQTELARKWENFKSQVPQMHRADAEMYFKRFLNKVSEYYTGTHINTTQERFIREFNDLKPLADWDEAQAKQDIETWISQGFNPDTLKRYVRQKYGEAHDEFVDAQWKQHHSKPIEFNPEYLKNPNAPYVLPF